MVDEHRYRRGVSLSELADVIEGAGMITMETVANDSSAALSTECIVLTKEFANMTVEALRECHDMLTTTSNTNE